MRHSIQPKSHRAVQQQSLSDDHVLIRQISQLNPNLPKPKLLKSCIRCRKHKTKCDAQARAPSPCSSCFKKGCACKMDYVLPPQRSDNLKNLISQVDFIKEQYETLSSYYMSIGDKLGVKIETFEDWREKNWTPSHLSTISDDEGSYSNNTDCHSEAGSTSAANNSNNGPMEDNTLINLIKLSDGSFISMDMHPETNQLVINNHVIQIDEFDKLVSNLLAKLHHINSIFLTSSEKDDINETDGSTSDCSSSISLPSPKLSKNDYATASTTWCDLKFDTRSLFKSNKFFLIMLISFYYPHFQINFQLFLRDYLISYYSIIETLNKSSNTSTYSANLLMKTLMNKQSSLSTPYPSSNVITFTKFQLKCLIDSEIFNSELFLKKLIQLLFLNVIMNGIDSNLEVFNQFVKFVELNINNNRKKLNFEKSESLKFIERFVQLLNLFQTFDITSSDLTASSQYITKKPTKSSSSIPNSLASFNITEPHFNEKNFAKFEQLIIKDFEFFQISTSNDNSLLTMYPDLSEISNIDTTTEDEQLDNITLQQVSLFKNPNNTTTSIDSVSTSSSFKHRPSATTRSTPTEFNVHDFKIKYSKVIDVWSDFFAVFEPKNSASHSMNNAEKLFIDDFLLELKVLNTCILIFKGCQEYQPLLHQILEHYSISDSLVRFIHLFNNVHNLSTNEKTLLSTEDMIGEFSSEKMQSLFVTMRDLIFRNTVYKESSSRLNDIQVILENVDWKKESTDDVLRKMGVL